MLITKYQFRIGNGFYFTVIRLVFSIIVTYKIYNVNKNNNWMQTLPLNYKSKEQ